MERYICIHGHFYQPPRENPWLEAVLTQDSAFPYHDWNQRVTAECYAPNCAARILDDKGRIKRIVSNYARMSFNIGPTLLSWLEAKDPQVYTSILEADAAGAAIRSGHGPAMAQCYNHMIMPLASERDRLTQCLWGVRDFKYRFGRDPEGMWLPETAVDVATLEVLAKCGIAFTVLAPRQAKRVRPIGSPDWKDVSNGRVDPAKPYKVNLPSGRSIAVFFYDGPVSQAVAFEGLLASGERYMQRLLSGLSDKRNYPQLMHIATDGESYGHHHQFGEMALAYALDDIELKGKAHLTNYAEFLMKHPPRDEAEIFERSSWSCAHGVERWRSDCGCNSGGKPAWSQRWRAPLRETLDWLRDSLAAQFERHGAEFFQDPWAARDDYIYLVLNRNEENRQRFFMQHQRRPLDKAEAVTATKLLEMQRHAMLMYTSCGWFFDDISGIETVQVMQYAGRAMQLARECFSGLYEEDFVRRIEAARSNVPERGTGRDIYKKEVLTRMVDLNSVAAHYAISSVFSEPTEQAMVYCYEVRNLESRHMESAKTGLLTGRCRVRSVLTGEEGAVSFGVLHLGDHDFTCGVRGFDLDEHHADMADELSGAFERGAFAELVRLVDKHFGPYRYTLKSLFEDEQRNIIDAIFKETLETFEASYRKIYEDHRILMNFFMDTGVPKPKAFITAAEFTLNLDLTRQLAVEADARRIREILKEFKKWGIAPETVGLEYTFRRTLEREMSRLVGDPCDIKTLSNLERLLETAKGLPFQMNLWAMQNMYYHIARKRASACKAKPTPETATTTGAAQSGGATTGGPEWALHFRAIGDLLDFNLDAVLSEGR